jgi:hypothetical protein
MVRSWDDSQTLSFNLNYECGQVDCKPGSFLYVPSRDLFGGASVLLPLGGSLSQISNYEDIQKFTSLIYDKSSMFINTIPIGIINNSSKTGLARTLSETLTPFGFQTEVMNTKKEELINESLENPILYYNGI